MLERKFVLHEPLTLDAQGRLKLKEKKKKERSEKFTKMKISQQMRIEKSF